MHKGLSENAYINNVLQEISGGRLALRPGWSGGEQSDCGDDFAQCPSASFL